MKYLVIVLFVSAFLCFAFMKSQSREIYDTCDGVQKFHTGRVPRIGGLAIYIACWVCAVAFVFAGKPFVGEFFAMLVSASFVFFAGLMEDLRKNIPPNTRLVAAFLSGAAAYFLIPAKIFRVDLPLFDYLLSYSLVSFAFTVFALAGVSNAFNIIDGFNGLASGVAIMVFGTYAYVSFLVNDNFLLYASLVMVFALLGFFIWNYPLGFIFLGDGGAYFVGFMAGLVGVLLVQKHLEVSAWFPMMLLAYPVWETVFSIYRKKILRGISPVVPDGVHFHMLFYKRVVRILGRDEFSKVKRNALTAPYLWFTEFLCVVPSVLFWRNTFLLILSFMMFAFLYVRLYASIVHFDTPKFLIFYGRR